MNHRMLALALLLATAAPSLAQAQDGTSAIMARALRAYRDLDFAVAATLLTRVLAGELDDSVRTRALTYLGAAEQFLGHEDSATAVFSRLVRLAPRLEPDTLVFPPEITSAYAEVRSRILIDTAVVASAATHVVEPTTTDTVTTLPLPPQPPPRPQPVDSGGAPAHVGTGFLGWITATTGATAANVRAQSDGAGLPSASGAVFGWTGSVRVDRFEVAVRYLEGSLNTRDLVEGSAALRFHAAPWVTILTGPQIRRYETLAGAERWATWQLGGRAEAPIFGSSVRAYALLWQGLGLSVNVPPGSGTMKGGEFGLTIDMPSAPFWFGLAYGIDRAVVRDAGRRETVESLTLSAGVRKRAPL